MLRTAVDERRYPRIAAMHHRIPEGRPGHPFVVNVSQGGACLWLGDPPQDSQCLALSFHSDGQDHVLRSRVVWSRPCAATTSPQCLARAVGWLAGIAFADENADTRAVNIPEGLLRAGSATVSYLGNEDSPAEPARNHDELEAPQEIIALDEQSVFGIKAATKDLMPLFAKHFSDVRVVLKRQQLEISASFRPPAEARRAEIEQPKTHPHDALTTVPASVHVAPQRDATGPRKAPFSINRRHAMFAISGVTIATVVATYLGIRPGRQDDKGIPGDTGNSLSNVPGWAPDVNEAFVNDWMKAKSAFDLPDATMRSVIQLLQHNDIYPPAHDLYDLSKYPVQAARAFSLMATRQAADGVPLDLGKLKNDLEWRLIAGARFPDEAPGGRYSSLQRELYNNVVVLGVVDLFHRRQEDDVVKEFRSRLARANAANTVTDLSALPGERNGSK